MRRMALGVFLYTPDRFGLTRIGDFLDAMGGYNEAESERVKGIAEIIRTSTAILWNVQVGEGDRLRPSELWPLPWDSPLRSGNGSGEMITEEERKRREKDAEKFLRKNFPGE